MLFRSISSSVNTSVHQSFAHFRQGLTVEQIAQARGLVAGTIYAHLGSARKAGETLDLERFFTPAQQHEISAVLEKMPNQPLSALREALGNRYDFGPLRLFCLAMLGKRTIPVNRT